MKIHESCGYEFAKGKNHVGHFRGRIQITKENYDCCSSCKTLHFNLWLNPRQLCLRISLLLFMIKYWNFDFISISDTFYSRVNVVHGGCIKFFILYFFKFTLFKILIYFKKFGTLFMPMMNISGTKAEINVFTNPVYWLLVPNENRNWPWCLLFNSSMCDLCWL